MKKYTVTYTDEARNVRSTVEVRAPDLETAKKLTSHLPKAVVREYIEEHAAPDSIPHPNMDVL